jgi:hypothetical protein
MRSTAFLRNPTETPSYGVSSVVLGSHYCSTYYQVSRVVQIHAHVLSVPRGSMTGHVCMCLGVYVRLDPRTEKVSNAAGHFVIRPPDVSAPGALSMTQRAAT